MSFILKGMICGVAALSAMNCLALSEEEYLKYIEAEASRLAEPARPVIPNAGKVTTDKEAAQLSQSEFEALLKAKQRGTYSFYESLLENDKAEVYKAFSAGADWRKIRRMIIDRKLHR
ncbi:hypothetical protein [Thiolapillus sp.]